MKILSLLLVASVIALPSLSLNAQERLPVMTRLSCEER